MNKILKTLGGAVAVAGVLLLTACAPDQGYIHDKQWSDAYETTSYQCYSRDSKTGACTFQMPVKNYHPASYNFDLYDGDDHGWVSVDAETYYSYEEGDFYDTNG